MECKVIISRHAGERIEQQGLDKAAILKEVRKLPDFLGKFHWTYRGNTIILEKTRSGKVVVKTVIASFKFKKQFVHRRKGRLVSR